MGTTTSNKGLPGVIAASSLGTLIEWYDFYIFGSLAVIISTKFFRQKIPQQHYSLPLLHLPQALLSALLALYFLEDWAILLVENIRFS